MPPRKKTAAVGAPSPARGRTSEKRDTAETPSRSRRPRSSQSVTQERDDSRARSVQKRAASDESVENDDESRAAPGKKVKLSIVADSYATVHEFLGAASLMETETLAQLALRYERKEDLRVLLEHGEFQNLLWTRFGAATTATADHLVICMARLLCEQWDMQSQTSSRWGNHITRPRKKVICILAEWVDVVVAQHESKLAAFISQIMQLLIPPMCSSWSFSDRRVLLRVCSAAFTSLDLPQIRKECMRVMGISIWSCLASNEIRNQRLEENAQLPKIWSHFQKKLKKSEQREQLEYDQGWFSALMRDFLQVLMDISADTTMSRNSAVEYCEGFLVFLQDLMSQLPTRRYAHALVLDHQVIAFARISQMYRQVGDGTCNFFELVERLEKLLEFPVDNHTGESLTEPTLVSRKSSKILALQRGLFSLDRFRELLSDFIMANLSMVQNSSFLQEALSRADNNDLATILRQLGCRDTPIVDVPQEMHRSLLLELIRGQITVSATTVPLSTPSYQTEKTLWGGKPTQLQKWKVGSEIPFPRLQLQFLSLDNYLLLNRELFGLEDTVSLQKEIESALTRMDPRMTTNPEDRMQTAFQGWSRVALPIESFDVIKMSKVAIGSDLPQCVEANVSFSVFQYAKDIRAEWDSLRRGDVLYLISVRAPHALGKRVGNDSQSLESLDERERSFADAFGIKHVRGCEVVEFLSENGDLLADEHGKPQVEEERTPLQSGHRVLRVRLDPVQYHTDLDQASEDIYSTFNVLLRRKASETIGLAIVRNIQTLLKSSGSRYLPEWLRPIFLGYGDPRDAYYSRFSGTVDFSDTFLDADHLRDSFPNTDVEILVDDSIVNRAENMQMALFDGASGKPPVKNLLRYTISFQPEKIVARSYLTEPQRGKSRSPGSAVRFTPRQIEAIRAASSPGLSLVVGPPGTGKTLVVTQVIANLLSSEDRILVVARSHESLDRLFKKLLQQGIPMRQVMRLTDGSCPVSSGFGKYGRVSAFLERRIVLLAEVQRLAQSMEIAAGDVATSCETARNFYLHHICSHHTAFKANLESFVDEAPDTPSAYFSTNFPFTKYFQSTPSGNKDILFPDDTSVGVCLEISRSCWHHIRSIFEELDEIRALELIRSSYDRANYLLTKQAKVVAMTSAQAAVRRAELVRSGFKYDTLIVLDAGGLADVETFLPLTLQEGMDGHEVRRVVLFGNNYQLPPVIRSTALRSYCHLGQSLFERLLRLGVPAVTLDAQGLNRPSIRELYSVEAFPELKDFPEVAQRKAFQLANPGFTFDYQFVNVGSYKDHGETEPSPGFYQNLGEAEYVVATYQYMRLIGYPAEAITIVTPYQGQRALLEDVIDQRCAWNRLFGRPALVTTIDKCQGSSNDYVLLSLVRTKAAGHICDRKRIVSALCGARLGVYVFGRKAVLETCNDLRGICERLLQRPTELALELGEQYGAGYTRAAKNAAVGKQTRVVKDVTEMGAYIYDQIQKHMQNEEDNETSLEVDE